LRTLRIALEAAYPEEDWGFTAQQAAEKRIKAWLVLADQRPPGLHNLMKLAALAEQPLDPRLEALQVFSVEARSRRGGGALPPASGEGRASGAP
jgi:HEPN domain-containing protein